MEFKTEYNLNSNAYHAHPFWGSTNLRNYLQGASFAKYSKDFPEHSDSAALRFGNVVHGLLQGLSFQVIVDPINVKTGEPFGKDTKAVKELLISDSYCLQSDYEIAREMINNFERHNQKFFNSCMKGEKEHSHFFPELQIKYRPDVATGVKLVDYKTVKVEDWTKRGLLSLCYKYGFQSAMYQHLEHLRTGELKPLFWVFMLKQAPFDTVIIDSSDFAYDNSDSYIKMNEGALQFSKVLELHKKCISLGEWGGLASEFEADFYGNRFGNKTQLIS